MKIRLITISKEEINGLEIAFREYCNRINHYTSFEVVNLKPGKSGSPEAQLKAEAEIVLKRIVPNDVLILLDEKGKSLSSVEFAAFLSGKINSSAKSILFVIGGAYGFDKTIYERSQQLISVSKMTLPHQLAKVVFAEQLYRAFTIIRNEKYHHGDL
ncbi:MAG: 23S rRNA (pseudouridine(1915)-N(3))-methyltransferase RlmH [Chitinophagaceae bacterium]|nr:23S rRNA (pseudouridine(1915)-N(3))-methyltransferase RlmH [Chitinophagaceae bacterium]